MMVRANYGMVFLFLVGFVAVSTMVTPVAANTPTASLSAAQGTAGATITVTGSGWRAGDIVTVAWTNPDWNIRIMTASDGSFATAFTIPDAALPGIQNVSISAGCALCTYGAEASQPFTVLDP